MEDISSQKHALRQAVKQKLAALPAGTIERESQAAQVHLLGLLRLLAGARPVGGTLQVAAYLATADELDLSGLWLGTDRLAQYSFPRTIQTDGENDLSFAPWPGFVQGILPDGWTRNRFGIAEPPLDAVSGQTVFDLVLMPCLSVDRYGARLGHGAGYYDRWLAGSGRAGGALLIACCLLEQLSPIPLPQDPFDIPIDTILTADGIAWREVRETHGRPGNPDEK